MNEIWKAVVGYEGLYEASNLGRIRSVHPNRTHSTRPGSRAWLKGVRNIGKIRVLRGINSNAGYLRVGLWNPSKHKFPRSFTIHSLIARVFLGPCPTDHEINHRNGNKHDNRSGNLEHVTRAANLKHARQILRKEWTQHGERHCCAKLSNAEVAEIRLAVGSHSEIARSYGVCQSTISRIRANVRRKNG